MVITCVGEFEGVPSKQELHDHVHRLLGGAAGTAPAAHKAPEEAKASCRSGSCRYCQIKKVFGTTNILANTCVYDGSNWGSCCKCARDRHGWTGFNQNACRHCSEGVREEKEDRLCVVSQTVDAGAVSR